MLPLSPLIHCLLRLFIGSGRDFSIAEPMLDFNREILLNAVLHV